MHISRIIIVDFQQFDFLDIDLSYPTDHAKAGLPLEKVCFIGKNGTGKTTLINLIKTFLEKTSKPSVLSNEDCDKAIKIKIDDEEFYIIKQKGAIGNNLKLLNKDIDNDESWIEDFKNRIPDFMQKYSAYTYSREDLRVLHDKIKDKKQQVLIYSPSEVHTNTLLQTSDVPNTNLNEALTLYKNFPYSNNISFQNVNGFWNLIIYQVKQRESDEKEFLELDENQNKVYSDLKKDFNKKNPFFLNRLSEIWNKILDKAGLFFDTEQVKIPMQLNDNLVAYIKLKSTKQNIAYSRVCSGIRHYIFRLGFTASLFFNRKIKSATVLIDEPENSLFPDLLYDLVEQYSNVTRRTQFFYATHSPIIASQFEPCERIILDFTDLGKVFARKGKAAIGDEPNDMLIKDFGIQSLLGKEGIKKWERYVTLKILINQENDETKKEILVKEFLEIGKAYNF